MKRRVRRLRAANPGKSVEVWAQDEARLGLQPITRRVWRLKGCRPGACGRTKYEWLYVYGFVRPATGQLFAPTLSRVNVTRMTDALGAFARHADPDGRKILVVIVDNAPWHRAKSLVVPPNVRLHFLPPYTPQLQPAEHLWPLVREALANDTFDTLDALRRRIVRRCRWLTEDQTTVQRATGFHWAVELEE